MTQAFDIVGIGAALIDTEIQVTDQDLDDLNINKGMMTLCESSEQKKHIQHLGKNLSHANLACGGSAANSMIASAHLGSRSFFTCKVADDADGNLFLAELTRAGVGHNEADQLVAGVTGKCLVMITPDAERTMNTCLGVSETLGTDNVEVAPLKDAKYLYIEGYLATSTSGSEAAIRLRNAALSRDVKVALSLSDPGIVEFFGEPLREILGKKVDLIFCNEAEALAWTQTTNLNEAAEQLKTDCQQYSITLGAEGAICWDGDQLIKVSAPETRAVNTNGAGDMFAGCMLAALNRGVALGDAAEFACLGASKVVAQQGPRLAAEQYRSLNEVIANLS